MSSSGRIGGFDPPELEVEFGYDTKGAMYVERDPSYPSSYSSRSYAARAPGSTTIINNSTPQYDSSGNLITGVLIGEALARNNQPNYYPPSPVYVEPTPSYVPEAPVAPVQDAPDSSWEAPSTQTYEAPTQETTSFEPDPAPSYEAPSVDTDFGSSNTDFGSSSSGCLD